MLFGGTRPTPENPAGRPGMTDSRITHCTLEEIGLDAKFGGGIRLAFGCDRNEVGDNRIDRTGRGGIFGDGAAELVVRRNRGTGSGGEGLGIEIIARDVVVSDNVVDGGAMIGLTVSNTRVKNNVLWARNTVRDCVQWGAEFQGESSGIAHHFFHDCRFEKTRKGGPRAGCIGRRRVAGVQGGVGQRKPVGDGPFDPMVIAQRVWTILVVEAACPVQRQPRAPGHLR